MNYAITMDAGLTHKPEELPLFLDAPHVDLVIGRRAKTKNVPLYRKFVSFSATVLYNIALRPFGSKLPRPAIHDVTSGYRRYSSAALNILLHRKLKAKTFDFVTESLMFVYRNGLSIIEVPITYEFSNSSFNWRVLADGHRDVFGHSFFAQVMIVFCEGPAIIVRYWESFFRSNCEIKIAMA